MDMGSLPGYGYGTYPMRKSRQPRRDLYPDRHHDDYDDRYDNTLFSRRRNRIPFNAFRMLGGALIIASILMFLFAFVAIGLNPCNNLLTAGSCNSLLLRDYGIGTVVAIAPWVLVTGFLGMLHSPHRRRLEAVRNAFMVMTVVTFLLCFTVGIFESLLSYEWYQKLTVTVQMTGAQQANQGMWIVLIIVMMLAAFVAAAASGFSCCCTPGICTPIVDKNGQVYTYESSVGNGDYDVEIIREREPRKKRPYIVDYDRGYDDYKVSRRMPHDKVYSDYMPSRMPHDKVYSDNMPSRMPHDMVYSADYMPSRALRY